MMGMNTVAESLSVLKCFIDNDQEGRDSFAQALSSGKINKASNLVSNKNMAVSLRSMVCVTSAFTVYSLISASWLHSHFLRK